LSVFIILNEFVSGGRIMLENMTEKENQFIEELLNWKDKKESLTSIYSYFFLLFGVFLIVFTIYNLFTELTDSMIIWLGIPGFLTGIFFILLYIILQRRIREMKVLSSIIKKWKNSLRKTEKEMR